MVIICFYYDPFDKTISNILYFAVLKCKLINNWLCNMWLGGV